MTNNKKMNNMIGGAGCHRDALLGSQVFFNELVSSPCICVPVVNEEDLTWLKN